MSGAAPTIPLIPIGAVFGGWTVLAHENSAGRWRYRCRCECGHEKLVIGTYLRSGRSTACASCASHKRTTHRPMVIGERHGRLVVVELLSGKSCRVLCNCGSERVVAPGNLRSGATRSCGCLAKEYKGAPKTHGASRTKLYRVYRGMLQRCNNPNTVHYKNYGGRGITVCARWAESFEAFRSDMGEPPADHLSLDRIDNDRGYEPGNCRWATDKDQARNTRRNVWVEHNGERLLATDWARKLGISRQRFDQRLRAGFPPERLFAPGNVESINRTKGRVLSSPVLILNGRKQTLVQWAKELGLTRTTIRARLRRNLPIEVVLSVEAVPYALRRRPTGPRKLGNYHCRACGGKGHNRATCENARAA